MGSEFKGGEAVKVEKTGGVSPKLHKRSAETWGYRFYYLDGEGGLPPFGGAVWGAVVWSGILTLNELLLLERLRSRTV